MRRDRHDPDALRRALGIRRRLRALAWNGWPTDVLCYALELEASAMVSLVEARSVDRNPRAVTDAATPEAWEKIARLFDHLALRFGPDEELRRHAETHSWVPPLAWDDDTIDDPTRFGTRGGTAVGDPDPIAVMRRINGDHGFPLRNVDRREAVRVLRARDHSDMSIARTLGIDPAQVYRDRKRLGLPAVPPPLLTRRTLHDVAS